jgi:hypothetical protein
VGCVFEISSGEPDLGNTTTGLILAASVPLTALFFWAAVKDTRAITSRITSPRLWENWHNFHEQKREANSLFCFF